MNFIVFRIYQFIFNRTWISSEVKVSEGCEFSKSRLLGCVKVGANTYIGESELQGSIVLGDNCKIYRANLMGKLEVGRYTSFWGPNINITSSEQFSIRVGSFCSIAKNVSFQSFNHNSTKVSSYFIGKNIFKEIWPNETVGKGNIEIGNDVWIGSDVVVLTGVKVADGAVIAANSVVNSDIPPYAIVGGSPARILKYRFDSETIEAFLKVKWWEWSMEKIKKHKSFFQEDLTDENLERLNSDFQ